MEDPLQELATLLSKNDRPDIQLITLENILAFTGSPEGLQLIIQRPELLTSILLLLRNPNADIAKRSSLILVNISACRDGPKALLTLNNYFKQGNLCNESIHVADPVQVILKNILDPDSQISDPCCMILSNMTRPSSFTETVIDLIDKSAVAFDQIINVFTKNKYNTKGQNLYYLGPVLSNLSQSPTVRKYILDQSKCVVQRLLPFTEFKDSIIKRGGVVGTLRNCCFETDYHDWLLSNQLDILPSLLLPLAGNTEYDDEDNDKLPSELQYLPDDKVREEDPDIRCMLLEAITQLCAKRENREYIRNKNTYLILRELHKWEKDKKALLACENLVDILIRTEEEIGEDNLKEVQVPEHLHRTFAEMEEKLLDEV